MTLGEQLRRSRERHPEKTALIFEPQSWSYAELDEITDRLAASLRRLGIAPGDRVALHFTNRPELLFGYYACFKIGAAAVPLNTRFRGAELEYVLNHSGARLFIGQPELFSEVQGVRSRLAGIEQFYVAASASDGSVGSDRGDTEAAAGVRLLAELLSPAEPTVPFPAVANDALAVILYTSGSTARPKGVMHSHFTLERTVASVIELGALAEDVVGIAAPLCHMAAFGCQLLPAHAVGATVVLLPRPDPAMILAAISEHRVSYFFGLPVTYQSLLDAPLGMSEAGAGDLSSLRFCLGGGDTVPVELQRRFQERLGVSLIEACGMTELVPYCANPIEGLNKAGSIGPPAPGVSARLVDEQGRDVPPGEIGEILLQSEAMMLGYWQDPEATAAVVRDGWLSTGDMARMDEDGYYWFIGRKKEIIIRGGSNISPPEVENALYQHPAVREAGVVGVPDAAWGEVVHAFVALHEGATSAEEELKRFAGQLLAAYKVPEAIHFLPELPKGPTGKVHRKTLREWAIAPAGS